VGPVWLYSLRLIACCNSEPQNNFVQQQCVGRDFNHYPYAGVKQ